MRYVVPHTKRGRVYWYWQRKGFPLTKLSDDEGERYLKQLELNAAADGAARQRVKPSVAPDLVWGVIRSYEETERYKRLAPGTKKYYDRFLRDIGRTFGDLPITQVTRQVAIRFVESYEAKSAQQNAGKVLYNLFDEAWYRGLIEGNPASKLRRPADRPRDAMWSEEDADRYAAAATGSLRTFFMLCRYTAQRPGDCLQMTWRQYNGTTIKLRQTKTKTLLEVPCHRALRDYLDGLERVAVQIVPHKGHEIRDGQLALRRQLNLEHLQMRDLRRTAMVNMAEAGARLVEIAAVSGHTIERTRRILETYIPRTKTMAVAAIAKWEENEKSRKKS